MYGVEIVPEAIEDAKRNAELNGITNAEFAVGEAETVIPKWYEEGITTDTPSSTRQEKAVTKPSCGQSST